MSAKQIDDLKIVLGQMIKVQNQNKRNLQNDSYIAVQVQDEDGQNERCLLFTEIELSDMPKVKSEFLMQKMVEGRIYSFCIGMKQLFLLKMSNRTETSMIFRISKRKLEIAEKRAMKNPQDLTKKSWLTDLRD